MRAVSVIPLLAVLASIPVPAPAAGAEEPEGALIFHGLLRDGADQDLDGHHELGIDLYDVPVGGELILALEGEGVEVSRGLFRVVLGGELGDPSPASLLDGGRILWLELRVDGAPLDPRLPVTAPSPTASPEQASGSWGTAPSLELLARGGDLRLYGPPLDAVAEGVTLVLALPEGERPLPFALPGEKGGEETYPEEPDIRQKRLDWLRGVSKAPFGRSPEGAMAEAWGFRDAMAGVAAEAEKSGEPPPGSSITAVQSVTGDSWVDIGPAPVLESTGKHSAGRIRAVAIDPSDSTGQTFYIGAAQGGVWKTENGGGSWVPLTDHEASLAIGALALDPQDSQIVYAGTGESSGYYGAGILKSTDGGSSWTQMGAQEFDYANGGARINAIAASALTVSNPDEQRTLLVAADSGLWRSTDGAYSWTKVHGGYFTDVVYDPHDTQTLYAGRSGWGIYKSNQAGALGTWTMLVDSNGELPTKDIGRIRLVAVEGSVPASRIVYASMRDKYYGQFLKGIWKSTSGGTSWERVTGHPFDFSQGLWATAHRSETESNDTVAQADDMDLNQIAEGWITAVHDVDFWRVVVTGNSISAEILADRASTSTLNPKLSLYDSTGSVVLAKGTPMVYDSGMPDGSDDERLRLFNWKTLTPGTYYVKVESSGQASTGRYQLSVIGIDLNCQCEYDQVLAVRPDNPSTLYMGQVKLHRSTDGGKNWSDIHDHGGSNWIHVDIHAAAFDPANPSKMLWGSDGGAFHTADGGSTWSNLNTNLSITQPYPGIAQHPTDPGFMLLGAQDIGTAKMSGGSWSLVLGGDGAFNAIASSSTWWGSSQRLAIFGTTDGGTSLHGKTSGLGRAGSEFIAPFILDPNNAQVLIAGGGEDRGSGMEYLVYRSSNGGDSWSINSQHLDHSITSLAFAPSSSSTYYAGTYWGRVWRTTDTGTTNWTNLTKAPLPGWRTVRDIAVHPTNPDIAYVVFGGFGTGHVFKTTNGGVSWTDVSGSYPAPGSLPDVPVHAIVVDPSYPNTLFIGTDTSIWRSTDGGASWYPFDQGLPRVAVYDLILGPSTGPGGRMRAATHGRGIWELRSGNDACGNATAITDGYYTGSTLGVTNDGDATCGSSTTSPDVWYRYTATCDGYLEVDTCGSGYDTVLSVHGETCPGSSDNERDCSDDCGGDPCSSTDSCSRPYVYQGQEYLIRVSGYGGAAGSFSLDVSCQVVADHCDEALVATSVPYTFNLSTAGGGVDAAPTCNGETVTAPGVWVSVTGTGNTMTASTCTANTEYDTKLSLYCAGCGGQSCVTANDDDPSCTHSGTSSTVSWCSSPGTLYHILVHGYQSQQGRFELDITDNGTPCGFALACNPANDYCGEAAPLEGSSITGDNTAAGTEDTASCADSNGDVWYEYDSACHGFVTFDTCGTGTLVDTVLSVYDGCGGREIACSDDTDGCGARAAASVVATPDRPLTVRVADYGISGVDEGTFPLGQDFSVTYPIAPREGLYLADGYADDLLRFDPFDRQLEEIGPMVISPMTGMTYHPGLGLMYGVQSVIDGTWLHTLNIDSGEASPFAEIPVGSVYSLTFNPEGDWLFAVENDTHNLIVINPYDAGILYVGPVGFNQIAGLAFDTATGVLYGADNDTDQLVTIDPETGTGTAVGPFGTGYENITGLAWDSMERILYGVNKDAILEEAEVVRIDTTTGVASDLGVAETGRTYWAITWVPRLPHAIAGQYYDEMIPAAGGCPVYWTGGFSGLPPGLDMDEHGKISGVPLENGTALIGFDLDDSNLSSPSYSADLQLRIRPSNDECDDWIDVVDGPTPVNTDNAITDGFSESACDIGGYDTVGSDVWYCYVATCTGALLVDMCDTTYDNKVAVYEGCGCRATPDEAIACDDDSCTGNWGAQFEVPVNAGQAYGIRVGGYGGNRGWGTLGLECSGDPAGGCCVPGACLWTTETECVAQGGEYMGAHSVCEPDSDGDGVADPCDACPADPVKALPGFCGCGIPDLNTDGDPLPDCVDDDDDGDGVIDMEDRSPLDRFVCGDFDADGCEDCSSGGFDPANDGPDTDGDGVCHLRDCDDTNGNTHPGAPETNDGLDNQCPGDPGYGLVDEIDEAGFYNAADSSEYSWPPQPGASDYEVVRSPLRDLTMDCSHFYMPVPLFIDPEEPGPNEVFYYLVRPWAPHRGSWGRNSDGVERTWVCP